LGVLEVPGAEDEGLPLGGGLLPFGVGASVGERPLVGVVELELGHGGWDVRRAWGEDGHRIRSNRLVPLVLLSGGRGALLCAGSGALALGALPSGANAAL